MTRLHDPSVHTFASDNYAGAHPEVLQAIVDAAGGHVGSYGADPYTQRLAEVVVETFGEGATIDPVLTGTGANVAALQALTPRWAAVICATTAHVYTDEGGAPERLGGIKLLTVPTPDGKLTPELIDRQAYGWGDQQRPQPLAVTITQSTELGTVYTPDEIRAVTDHAHTLGMRVHLDGARLANAAASLGVPLRAITRDAGVDSVSFGGTKNGLVLGESVVTFSEEARAGLVYLRKMDAQLASKMRFVSAQFLAMLEGDLWLRSATRANAMAARLADGLATLPGVAVTQAVDANAVFVVLPPEAVEPLRAAHHFYDWNRATGEVRLMCSFDTTEAHVDRFVEDARTLVG
ncbi:MULTISPECIES: low specificity L-threonine aldolase [Frigoribacterium]|uniref:threonine aldolase family protein n=1 Tax=Frigoribacterium TaxID=96492 RepID=UPI0006FD504F|nr:MULTISPECIES: low specificity L-threonine aldolase [Frigoribacterium]KQM23548.1 threonine aldolase [Frigoribacterium sp. Leaf8]KQO45076.1 threonine aldolase [Frigoribacterium sp. Leaf254]KQT36922.1 threonine aldolase [Frigoribacterium sp. Leaf415]ROS53597.1 L-threonine aldolase [Frigoribacterium sp. PhB118]VXB00704.1 Low specificity L-threonine aldolase [Frigoribacterium sp. 9N]